MQTYAFITPSYAPDFERCRVLAESVRRYAAPDVDHYIIVDRRDERLFAELRGARTHVVIKQDILPWWLFQVPLSSRWWLNLKGLPGRGWIIQQIVKLSIDAITRAEVCVFLDSDVFLVKRFDPRAAERAGRVPLFREELPFEIRTHSAWLATAADLLGLPSERGSRTSYVGPAVTWRRANLTAMHRRVEQVTGRGWVEALCSLLTFSEYDLYGVFCERVLGEASGHYPDGTISVLNYWPEVPLDDRALGDLRRQLRPEHSWVMINAKSKTPVPAIRRAFELGA